MTPPEFKMALAFLDSIAPHYLSQCGLVSEDPTKDTATGLRFWRDQFLPFSVEAFKEGCQEVVKRTQVFPNMADLLKATREAQSVQIGDKDPILSLPGAAPKTTPLNELALHVDKGASEHEREDVVGRGLRMLQERKMQVTKIVRSEGMARHEHKTAAIKEGDLLYSAIIFYVGPVDADWEGLGRDHDANYALHQQASQERVRLHNLDAGRPQ